MNEAITIAHQLTNFCVTEELKRVKTRNGIITVITGEVRTEIPRICPVCQWQMYLYLEHHIHLQHIPIMGRVHVLKVGFVQSNNEICGCSKSQSIPFKVLNHRITKHLMSLAADYLSKGFTLTEISQILHL
jgi:hypothetical protein